MKLEYFYKKKLNKQWNITVVSIKNAFGRRWRINSTLFFFLIFVNYVYKLD